MNKEPGQERLTDLAQVFRDLPVGFCTVDLNFRFVFVNHWLAALHGLPVGEHIGQTICDVIPDTAADIEAQLRKVVAAGATVVGGDVAIETPEFPGEKRLLQHTYAPIGEAAKKSLA